MTRFLYQFSFTVAVCGVVGIAGCSKGPSAEQGGDQAVPVTVATVEQKTVPIALNGFGTVEEYAGVAVKAQVTGILTAVHFYGRSDGKKGRFAFEHRPSSL